ncbi:hypothetical protein [Micromonospora sp. NPDC047740]
MSRLLDRRPRTGEPYRPAYRPGESNAGRYPRPRRRHLEHRQLHTADNIR